jgi:hypothetical protein
LSLISGNAWWIIFIGDSNDLFYLVQVVRKESCPGAHGTLGICLYSKKAKHPFLIAENKLSKKKVKLHLIVILKIIRLKAKA